MSVLHQLSRQFRIHTILDTVDEIRKDEVSPEIDVSQYESSEAIVHSGSNIALACVRRTCPQLTMFRSRISTMYVTHTLLRIDILG